MTDQKNLFLQSEGDAWYKRNVNADSQETPDVELIQKYTKLFSSGKVLEIGCAHGNKLNDYRSSCTGYGTDPSAKAIKEGSALYADLHLSQGTANSLDFSDQYFEMVVFGFCLYLVDRSLLLRAISEADRVLKNKGFLVIKDFDTNSNYKRPYKHAAKTFSYKQNYANIFLSSGLYSLVEKISYSHQGRNFISNPQERIATSILYKDFDSEYVSVD